MYCYQIVFLVTQWMQIYFVSPSNLEEIVKNFSTSLIYSVGIFQLFVCTRQKAASLVETIYRMEKEIQEENIEEHLKIHRHYGKLNYLVSKYFTILGLITGSLVMFAIPILEMYFNEAVKPTQRFLPLSSWFPFDEQAHYYVAYLVQVLGGYLGTYNVAVTDVFFYAIMIFGIGQIKILQQRIVQFKETAERNCGIVSNAEAEELKILKDCVKKHNTVIQYGTVYLTGMKSR